MKKQDLYRQMDYIGIVQLFPKFCECWGQFLQWIILLGLISEKYKAVLRIFLFLVLTEIVVFLQFILSINI